MPGCITGSKADRSFEGASGDLRRAFQITDLWCFTRTISRVFSGDVRMNMAPRSAYPPRRKTRRRGEMLSSLFADLGLQEVAKEVEAKTFQVVNDALDEPIQGLLRCLVVL